MRIKIWLLIFAYFLGNSHSDHLKVAVIPQNNQSNKSSEGSFLLSEQDKNSRNNKAIQQFPQIPINQLYQDYYQKKYKETLQDDAAEQSNNKSEQTVQKGNSNRVILQADKIITDSVGRAIMILLRIKYRKQFELCRINNLQKISSGNQASTVIVRIQVHFGSQWLDYQILGAIQQKQLHITSSSYQNLHAPVFAHQVDFPAVLYLDEINEQIVRMDLGDKWVNGTQLIEIYTDYPFYLLVYSADAKTIKIQAVYDSFRKIVTVLSKRDQTNSVTGFQRDPAQK